MFAYVGCYTTPDRDGRGEGISVYRVDPVSGAWSHIQTLGGLENPSLFTLNRDMTRLYSVHGGRNMISVFNLDRATGRLTLINQQDCQGNNPVDSALDPTERNLIIGNYGTGTVAVMPVAPDGSLLPVSQVHVLEGSPGPDPHHQASSHPHAVIFDPSGRFVVVPDKGFDRTFIFRFAGGRITPAAQGSVASASGAAPRHTIFHPALPVLYVNNELDSTVTAFRWDRETGHLAESQVTSTIPGGHDGRNTTAEIAVSGDGRHLYVSNRGQDSVVLYDINPVSGHLSFRGYTPTGGKRPRFFAIGPNGRALYAANQDSDDITGFRIAPANGALSATGIAVRTGSPSAIRFVPAP